MLRRGASSDKIAKSVLTTLNISQLFHYGHLWQNIPNCCLPLFKTWHCVTDSNGVEHTPVVPFRDNNNRTKADSEPTNSTEATTSGM